MTHGKGSHSPRAGVALGFAAGIAIALSLGADWDRSGDVLRVRGLIVEDEAGRPRVVLGAPLAELEGRIRTDPTVGLVVLDERGVDRVSVGSPTTAPQSGGVVRERVGDASGIEVNDENGNERAGFGYLEGGRVVLGIDYADGAEAVTLFTNPDWGFSGLQVSGRGEGDRQRVFIGTKYDGADAGMINLDAPDGRWMSLILDEGGPKWLVRPDGAEALTDVLPALR